MKNSIRYHVSRIRKFFSYNLDTGHLTHDTGMSLIEILVVIGIFAILATLATRSVLLTLRGAKKSENVTRVRENVNYALSVIERQIRNAERVTCPISNPQVLDYLDQNGTQTSFSCTTGSSGYIASGSARLTNTDVSVISCSFSCTPGTSNVLPSVTATVVGRDASAIGVEGAEVSSSTQIFLRGY